MEAALAGAGLTRTLAYQVDAQLRQGSLVRVLGEYEPALWPVNLGYLHQGRLPLKVRAFLDFAVPRLRTRIEAGAPI